MKVLIVTPSYLPIIGGSETLVQNLVTSLNESNISTDIMTLNMNTKWILASSENVERNNGFNVFKISASNLLKILPINPFYYLLRINVMPKLGFMRKFESYDIIHFLGESDLSLPFFSQFIKKPKIMHCVSIPLLDTQFRRHRVLKRFFVTFFRRLADLYIVFSSDEEKVLLHMGISREKIRILTYGVNEKIFHPDETKRLDNLILFVGRIDEIKGLHVLLKSLPLLKIKTNLVIVGPASKSDYFEMIKRMYQKINDQKFHKVDYMGDLNQDDLVQWYQRATVLVRPDLVGASGPGCSTLEALACGTPVIGVQNHVIKHGVNGLIVPRNDPVKLAQALNKVLADQRLRERYGLDARRTIEQSFSLKSNMARLIAIYENMLHS